MKIKTKGYIYGIVSAVTYGMNPLFALPLYAQGVSTDAVLFYRYVAAMLLLWVLMRRRGLSLHVPMRDVPALAGFGALFALSSLFLFGSYNYMDAGIASTILFVYPVMVALLMCVFFGERLTALTVGAIALALAGIALLYHGPGGATLSLTGIAFVLTSALAYAVYMVLINKSRIGRMPAMKLTFYVLLFGACIFLVRLMASGGVPLLPSPSAWGLALCLGLFPTVISLVLVTLAINYIGSTPTAIIGALEPVTAVFFGVTIFGEHLSPRICVGIVLILCSVTLIIAGKRIRQQLQHAVRRLRQVNSD